MAATVRRKGDPDAGGVLVVLRARKNSPDYACHVGMRRRQCMRDLSKRNFEG